MFSKSFVPCLCTVIAVLSFSLSHFLSQGQADTIGQDSGTTHDGAKCCLDSVDPCPSGGYGCSRITGGPVTCGAPYNSTCPLWNKDSNLPVGTCKNGYVDTCTDYATFWCCAGTAYVAPQGQSTCDAGNQQCYVKQGVASSCDATGSTCSYP